VPAVADTVGAQTIPLEKLRGRCAERLDSEFVIDRLASIGTDELFGRVVTNPAGTLPDTWASILPPADAVISVRLRTGSTDTVDVVIAAPDGAVVARLDGLRYGVLDGDDGAPASPRRLVHRLGRGMCGR